MKTCPEERKNQIDVSNSSELGEVHCSSFLKKSGSRRNRPTNYNGGTVH
jgi:hypothetical protein